FSKRLSLHFRNAFSLTSNPYDSFKDDAELPNVGILNRPNESALGSNIRSTTEESQGDIVYQLGRHTSVGVGESFDKLNYETIASNTSGNSVSLHSRIWSAHAFYSHQLTARYSLGVQYTAQGLASEGNAGQFTSLSH